MLRMLQIFCVFICVSTGAVITLCIRCWGHENPEIGRICAQPGIVERFKETHNQQGSVTEQGSPLVTQAQAFAVYLEGPSQDKEVVAAKPILPPSAPSLPEVTKVQSVPSAKFKLQGTSYYPNDADRSMALISEPGSPEGNERWVKEGTRLGYFVIEKIKHSAIMYRDAGGLLHEMSVEHNSVAHKLVRNHIPSLSVIAQAESDQTAAPRRETDSNSVDR